MIVSTLVKIWKERHKQTKNRQTDTHTQLETQPTKRPVYQNIGKCKKKQKTYISQKGYGSVCPCSRLYLSVYTILLDHTNTLFFPGSLRGILTVFV